MGAEGLEPSRLLQSTDFHPPAAFAAATGTTYAGTFQRNGLTALRIGLSLYPRLNVRVAPVESLHLQFETMKYER